MSMSSPDLIGNIELEEKLKELEIMIRGQKEIIDQQKDVITEQKGKISHLEMSSNKIDGEEDNLDDID